MNKSFILGYIFSLFIIGFYSSDVVELDQCTYRTGNEGDWSDPCIGSDPEQNPLPCLLENHFDSCFGSSGVQLTCECSPDDEEIKGKRIDFPCEPLTLTFTSPEAIQNFLPQLGAPGVIQPNDTLTNPDSHGQADGPISTSAGRFAGEVTTLELNLRLDRCGDFGENHCSTPLSSLYVCDDRTPEPGTSNCPTLNKKSNPQTNTECHRKSWANCLPFYGYTIQEIHTLAKKALLGCCNPMDTSPECDPALLTDCVALLNKEFVSGRTLKQAPLFSSSPCTPACDQDLWEVEITYFKTHPDRDNPIPKTERIPLKPRVVSDPVAFYNYGSSKSRNPILTQGGFLRALVTLFKRNDTHFDLFVVYHDGVGPSSSPVRRSESMITSNQPWKLNPRFLVRDDPGDSYSVGQTSTAKHRWNNHKTDGFVFGPIQRLDQFTLVIQGDGFNRVAIEYDPDLPRFEFTRTYMTPTPDNFHLVTFKFSRFCQNVDGCDSSEQIKNGNFEENRQFLCQEVVNDQCTPSSIPRWKREGDVQLVFHNSQSVRQVVSAKLNSGSSISQTIHLPVEVETSTCKLSWLAEAPLNSTLLLSFPTESDSFSYPVLDRLQKYEFSLSPSSSTLNVAFSVPSSQNSVIIDNIQFQCRGYEWCHYP